MNVVVYTAIFGSMPDKLQELPKFEQREGSRVHFHAYMDGCTTPTPHKSGWVLMPAKWQHKNPRLRARRHKLMAHELYPNVDASIWLDGCLTPKDSPLELVELYLQCHDICMFEHMERSCVYREAEACKKQRKDSKVIIDNLIRRYRIENYPADNGLAETTCVMRRHTAEMMAFNRMWWAELQANSIRDQLSCNYVLWKLHLPYMTFEGQRTDCAHFDWISHR